MNIEALKVEVPFNTKFIVHVLDTEINKAYFEKRKWNKKVKLTAFLLNNEKENLFEKYNWINENSIITHVSDKVSEYYNRDFKPVTNQGLKEAREFELRHLRASL